jgi:hypothetical protein
MDRRREASRTVGPFLQRFSVVRLRRSTRWRNGKDGAATSDKDNAGEQTREKKVKLLCSQPQPSSQPQRNMSATDDNDDDALIFETILDNDLEYLGERVIFADTAEDRLKHWKAFEVST